MGRLKKVARRPDSLKCFKEVIVGKKKTRVGEFNLEVSLETKFFPFSGINLTPWLSTFLEASSLNIRPGGRIARRHRKRTMDAR